MEVAVKGKAKRKHLNAEECNELVRSAGVADALTQPHTSTQSLGHRDPNRGLYPRTPTKRWKRAPLPGSPSVKQKGINAFFSVKGFIRSSPHKSSLPSTSTSSKELKDMVEEEEEEDDDVSLLAAPLMPPPREEEDDDSLLAAVMMPDPDEEEIDDDSLLAAGMVPDSEPQKEQEVDYLEGMTAEMFGGDDEFGQCGVHNEEEVEPLPDAHYGLLGTGRHLLRPQGCIDDLPEEVLRQILCHVPAQDLYRNVSLVCHRWKNVVEDTTFVPFKKQYYRYMMREKETMEEVVSILKNSGITDPALSQHSIRNLVVLMAQHKVRDRVAPENVLECVKKHRLFPQAEASIRLCIPDIRKSFNLGIEGPNPYAAMAIVLILSESVDDVQALVSLLTSCMSHSAISEYLSHMAMMLLALMRNDIQISNRLHYNIYYMLHLMENGPFSVNSGQSGQPQIHLTREQQQVLSHNIQPDHVVKIIAFAGTGKTTTLIKYAEQRPHLRFLYVAFNNSVAREATLRFPRNVECRTVHSLAYKDVGWRYKAQEKLAPGLKPFAINSLLPKGHGGFTRAKVVSTTLSAFLASTDEAIATRHVPSTYITSSNFRIDIDRDEKLFYVNEARKIWKKMKDPSEKSKYGYYMTHDGYLKLWQLQDPKPRLSDRYDALFIDEAQDCTPAVMDVLLSQSCGKILVGDPHQQIYTFRGAVNALHATEHTHIYYLTQSFRFGADIAYVGATILNVCKKVEKILVGGKKKSGVSDETTDKAAKAVSTGVSYSPGKIAILSRCNLGVFSEAVRLIDINPHCRIHFVGDVKTIGLEKILDIWCLMQQPGAPLLGPDQRPRVIRDPIIRSFVKKSENPFLALKMYAMQTEDKELEGKVAIVEKYRRRVPELVMRLNGCSETDYHKAGVLPEVGDAQVLAAEQRASPVHHLILPQLRHARLSVHHAQAAIKMHRRRD
ncbi:F-box DNA helicase 1 isoform X2 [Mugil cephalus]|uniref:F-box DNA helicase 1 isoform X2 n=1 Tax=Mugil cephalus TaxID=48193 RepID=UPI001FB7ABBA|nr:F-box DNA helicase 1 isoform X2 [Mugil cephalus]